MSGKPPICANCGIEIRWRLTIVDGLPYCCLGCSRGGPCECDYSQLPRTDVNTAIHSLWDDEALRAEFEAEWALMERTLVGMVSADELGHYKQVDWQAIEDSQRLVFVPIFYAVGRKTNDG